MDNVDIVGGPSERDEKIPDAVRGDLAWLNEDHRVELEALRGDGRQEADALRQRGLAPQVCPPRPCAFLAHDDRNAAAGGPRLAVESLLRLAAGGLDPLAQGILRPRGGRARGCTHPGHSVAPLDVANCRHRIQHRSTRTGEHPLGELRERRRGSVRDRQRILSRQRPRGWPQSLLPRRRPLVAASLIQVPHDGERPRRAPAQ